MPLDALNMPDIYKDFLDHALAVDTDGRAEPQFLRQLIAETSAARRCAACGGPTANVERVVDAVSDYYHLDEDQEVALLGDLLAYDFPFSPDGKHCPDHAE